MSAADSIGKLNDLVLELQRVYHGKELEFNPTESKVMKIAIRKAGTFLN